MCALGWSADAPRAFAHPMGNFSINHYARFRAKPGGLDLRTILDFAEIPTVDRLAQLDPDGDGKIGAAEKSAFLRSEIAATARGLSVKIDGRPAKLGVRSSQIDVRPGAGGLQTLRVLLDWRIAWPFGAASAKAHRVTYSDANFPNRGGWMEIVATADPTLRITNSNASPRDRSRELLIFPTDVGTIAPRQRQASFSVVAASKGTQKRVASLPGAAMAGAASAGIVSQTNEDIAGANNGANAESSGNGDAAKVDDTARGEASGANTQTPQNRFTQSIAEKQLTPGLILGGLLAALAFGAVHALSPGHGKTMVAAYLVGSRGTPRHAVTLGLVVTVTHTLGVFALGFALLFASQYVVAERLFPFLSAASGLLIFGVGLWLFMSRYQDLSRGSGHDHFHDHGDHDHSHDEIGLHSHSHGAGVHSHGGRAHSHAVPDGPITLKTLVALGVSGGIVPCPEALVVLLAAVKLHRIGYGMLLITAFSVGLAAALISIGLIVVAARARFGGSLEGRGGVLTRYLPLGSAAAITVIGIVLTLQATGARP